MSKDEIGEEFDEDEEFSLTEKGAVMALAAYRFFKTGLNHDQIAQELGLTDDDDPEAGKQHVQLLIAMADHAGLLDYYDEHLREQGIDPMEDTWM